VKNHREIAVVECSAIEPALLRVGVDGTQFELVDWSPKETKMAQSDYEPEDGKQVPTRPHDTGSQANETVDGLDAETEALRRATEDPPAEPGKIEKTPVFDRADLPPKI
jgi:hypothetical protein